MGRPITNRSKRYALHRERYGILIELGASWMAATACRSPERFVALVRSLGADPGRWPHLTEIRRGGHPRRLGTPSAERAKVRYHELRRLGASASFASMWSKSDESFETAKRKLALGIGKR